MTSSGHGDTHDPSDNELPDAARRLRDTTLALRDHPARIAYQKWDALMVVVHAQRANRQWLTEFLDAPKDNEDFATAIITGHKSGITKVYFMEVFRLLHNYLATVASLIDHSRKLVRGYEDGDFASQYEQRVREITDAELGPTLKDLRNYLLHNAVPPISLTMALSGDTQVHDFSVQLDTEELLRWGKWSSASKTYLGARQKLVIRDCVQEYASSIQSLHEWLFAQYSTLHRSEIEDQEKLQTELRTMLPKNLMGEQPAPSFWGPFN